MESVDKLARRWAFYIRKVKEYMAYRGMTTPRRRRRFLRLTGYKLEMVFRSGYYTQVKHDVPPDVDKITFRGEPMPKLDLLASYEATGAYTVSPADCGHPRGQLYRCMDCGEYSPDAPEWAKERWKLIDKGRIQL